MFDISDISDRSARNDRLSSGDDINDIFFNKPSRTDK